MRRNRYNHVAEGITMNQTRLHQENLAFRGTTGISENTGPAFRPAFLDRASGQVELSRNANGEPANIHLICWLPREWAVAVTGSGAIAELKSGIISGFECDGAFYTRDEMAEL